ARVRVGCCGGGGESGGGWEPEEWGGGGGAGGGPPHKRCGPPHQQGGDYGHWCDFGAGGLASGTARSAMPGADWAASGDGVPSGWSGLHVGRWDRFLCKSVSRK